MARKSVKVTITDDGEDKSFLITRMSGEDTENWALELFFAMSNADIEIPELDEMKEMGFAGIAQLGFKAIAQIPYEKAKPLLDKMMTCVQALPNPDDDRVVRALVPEDTVDMITRLKLRKEVFNLHTDFLKAVKE